MSIKITQALLDDLTEQAKVSSRLRISFDLRNSSNDSSQRMLNAIEPGSIVPIHRHRYSSETVIILRGRVLESFYNQIGELIDVIELFPGGNTVALNIPINQWHSIRSLESGTVIMECKDGPYEALPHEDILIGV